MIKVQNTLASLRREQQYLLRKRQIHADEIKLKKICDDAAKSCGISKPVNYTVNSGSFKKFRDIDVFCDENEWAPWSFVRKMQKKLTGKR